MVVDPPKEGIKTDELRELMNIPEFERLLYHHLLRLKNEFPHIVAQYNSLKSEFKKTAYGHMLLCTANMEKVLPAYHFQLKRVGSKHWRVSVLEPDPPPQIDIKEIIPDKIVQLVGLANVNPDEMKTLRSKVKVKGKLQEYEVRYTMFSDSHALGSIKRVSSADDGKDNFGLCLDSDAPEENYHLGKCAKLVSAPYTRSRCEEKHFDDLEAVKWFLYYLRNFPDVALQLMQDFYTRIKPTCESTPDRNSPR